MKGIIVNCLQEMITKNDNKSLWPEILKEAGVDPFAIYFATDDVDDAEVLKLFASTATVLKVSPAVVTDTFGEYWVCQFAPRIYELFYRNARNAKEFISKMDYVHLVTTETVPNAHPPHFEYDWQAVNILHLRYISERGLLDLLISLIKGVGIFFGEELQVRKLSRDRVEIVFPEGDSYAAI